MNNKIHNNNKSLANYSFLRNCVFTQNQLNRLAMEYNNIATTMLPAGVFGGILRGYEPEIRQDAILLALDWHTKRHNPNSDENNYSIHRSMATALYYVKKRYARHLYNLALREMHSSPIDHVDSSQANISNPIEFDVNIAAELVQTAISKLLLSGRISIMDAMISTWVFVDREPVKQVASRIKVDRSAVYQRLRKNKTIIRSILSNIEIPNLYV